MMIDASLHWVIEIPDGAQLPADLVEIVRAWAPEYTDGRGVRISYDPQITWDAQGNTARIGHLLRAIPRSWVTREPSSEEAADAIALLYDIAAAWETVLLAGR